MLKLMCKVSLITSKVPGSSSAHTQMHNEIHAMMFHLGLPSFFLTINPADCYSLLVQFLAGKDIDIDALLPDQVSNYWDQATLIAKNPFIVARFFDDYIKTFVSSILGFDKNQKPLDPGILGIVKGYYGCVEAQGRGTLHCHMLIWIEGSLDPQEIKDHLLNDPDNSFRKHLIAFLDDTIKTEIPPAPNIQVDCLSDSFHACSVRCPPSYTAAQVQKDLHNLVLKCQVHTHTDTCYKYWKGPGHPKECRFDLSADKTQPETTFHDTTGELHMHVTDGLVNNFCETIMQAVRCNMDINFIGSGQSVKAILYYITDYITKTQLKTHIAYGALLSAVRKLQVEQDSGFQTVDHAK